MAEIRPFRGIRYNEAAYTDLSPVLAPPYDVISPAEHKQLRERSDRNVVQLILSDRPASAKGGRDRYARAAQWLDDWLVDETLLQEQVPAIYLLDQEFKVDGSPRTRRAFIARLRLEAFGKGSVFPHEQTMPGPKADRLALMQATRMNMSQVFGLYPDDGAVRPILDAMAELDPVAEGTGVDGVRNVLRVVYHAKLIGALAETLKDKRIVVADGHHRYETAVAYRDEMRLRRGALNLDRPYEFVSVALVAMSDPGLVIRATHRLVAGLGGVTSSVLFQKAAGDFELEEIAPDPAAILARLAELADRHAFGIVTHDAARIFIRKTGTRAADGSPEELDTHILHHRVFSKLLQLGADAWRKGGPVRYIQSADECVDAVQRGDAQLAALVNPTRMDEVEAVALSGGTMPPKSTFFYPKLPTGLVINPLI